MEHLPTTELIIRDGQPVWLVQGGGMEAAHADPMAAMRMFREEAQRRSLRFSDRGPWPRRGPSEVDEPGV